VPETAEGAKGFINRTPLSRIETLASFQRIFQSVVDFALCHVNARELAARPVSHSGTASTKDIFSFHSRFIFVGRRYHQREGELNFPSLFSSQENIETILLHSNRFSLSLFVFSNAMTAFDSRRREIPS